MNKLKPFDPVVVGEVRDRVRHEVDKLKRADHAATALLWFNEYAWGNPPLEVLKVPATVVASSTPGADHAAVFVRQAAMNLAPTILDEAIRLAKLQMNENARKKAETYDVAD